VGSFFCCGNGQWETRPAGIAATASKEALLLFLVLQVRLVIADAAQSSLATSLSLTAPSQRSSGHEYEDLDDAVPPEFVPKPPPRRVIWQDRAKTALRLKQRLPSPVDDDDHVTLCSDFNDTSHQSALSAHGDQQHSVSDTELDHLVLAF